MSDVWVLNASPIILLGKIGRLDLPESLAAKAVVPNAVFLEIQAGIGEHQAVRSTADWAAPHRGSQTDGRIEHMAMLKRVSSILESAGVKTDPEKEKKRSRIPLSDE